MICYTISHKGVCQDARLQQLEDQKERKHYFPHWGVSDGKGNLALLYEPTILSKDAVISGVLLQSNSKLKSAFSTMQQISLHSSHVNPMIVPPNSTVVGSSNLVLKFQFDQFK